MATSRYDMDEVILNEEPEYKEVLKKRNLKKIYHYATPRLKTLTPLDYSEIKTISHIWTLGDKYYKLANRYYQDPTLWWLIAWFNQKPTDAHLSEGHPIFIPIPVEDALYYYNTK
jgi:hypothetical protein